MAVFNIPDIYGRFYLVNFDNVKVRQKFTAEYAVLLVRNKSAK